MKIVLPDSSELELPDGATGLDAARVIGPKLAEQSVLARVNGVTRDLRLPLEDGESVQFLTTRDALDPDALWVLRHSTAHLLAEAVMRLHPGVKIAIGPPIADGFYYDFEFPEPISETDLEAIEEEIRREIAEGREWAREELSREEAIARFEAEGQPYKVELARDCRGRHLALHPGCVHRSVPRSAPPERDADQGGQADEPCRRVLARGREEHPAHADLRNCVLLASRPRRAPRASRAGARARPSQARNAARPLPSLGPLTRVAVLASRRAWCSGMRSKTCDAARTAGVATSR